MPIEFRDPTTLKPHVVSLELYGEIDVGDLKESIEELGILVPIIITEDGNIISGHRRWKTASELGMNEVPIEVEHYANEWEEKRAILEYNRYRQKTITQRMREAKLLKVLIKDAIAQRKLAGIKPAEEIELNPITKTFDLRRKCDEGLRTDILVARETGFDSKDTFRRVEKVYDKAMEGDKLAVDLLTKLDEGKVTPYSASKLVKREEELEEQRGIIEEGIELPPGLYDVIVIDPPWPYGREYDPETSRVASPYPEMSLEELRDIELPAADDCILWLWTTNAFMHSAYHLLEAWGFVPKTILTWDKQAMGIGVWLRGITEHCILATRGNPKVNLTNQTTLISERRRGHSRKPDIFYRMVEELCGGMRRLDYFSGEKREGWEQYGIGGSVNE